MDGTESHLGGALDELAADPSSRKRFLRMAGGGAVAAGLAAVLAACGEEERTTGNQVGGAGVGTAQFGQGDAGIVAYALFLERLEVAFYEEALASGRLKGRGLELAKRFHADEQSHAKSLEGALQQLGGKEPAEPTFAFALENEQGILVQAQQLETVGAGAYLGQVARIRDKKILAVALSIHSVEARHAAALAQLLGRPIAPDGPFANPSPSSDVIRQTTPFLT
ncbi:MAG: ferritin-like domain-containing protein [Actinomycetota bacterium]|nr:ferritin-like domain-containing protein [Actinomycetota bacterium]